MRSGASLCVPGRGLTLVLWLALGLSLACEDADEQRFPFSYETREDVVLVDAGEAPLDAALSDAALVEDVEALEDVEAGLDDEQDPLAALEEGDVGALDAGDADALDGGAGDPLEEDEELGLIEDAPEEGAAGTRDDELFSADDEGNAGEASDGGPLSPGQLPPDQSAPAGMTPGGPVRFPPAPPGGAAAMPLYPGESFDVATLTGGYTAVVMKNVALRLDEDVNVYVISLSGALVPVETDVVDLDRPGALRLVVDEAEVRISEEDLGRVFARYLFDDDDSFGGDFDEGPQSPLRDVEVSLERGRMVLKARLEDGGDDIEIRGTLEPTVSGDVAFIPTSLRRDDRPVDSLEDIFEEGLGALGFGSADALGGGALEANVGPAFWIDADAMYFDLEAIVPAPALEAEVIDVRTSGEHVRFLLEGNAPEVRTLGPPGSPENYVELRGGAVRFGKVIMPRADILLLDEDESDPLDLSLHRFDEQLIAGDTRIRPDLGIEATLPDFDDIDESAFEVPDEGDEGDEGDAGDTADGDDADAGADDSEGGALDEDGGDESDSEEEGLGLDDEARDEGDIFE